MAYFDDRVKKAKKDIKYHSDWIAKSSIEVDLLHFLFDKFGDSPDRFFYSCKGFMESREESISEYKEELKNLIDELARYKELAK